MTIRKILLPVAFGLLVIPLAAHTADRKKGDIGRAKEKPAAVTVQQPAVTAPEAKTVQSVPAQIVPAETAPSQTATAVVNPQAGEQIKWQVVAGGGGASSSTNFKMSATVGQTAAGLATSTSYKVNQGFWQTFAPPSCCAGVTGDVNVNGTVNLADLSSLVSYLTGGGFVPSCSPEADVNASGTINLADLSSLVSYLTAGGYVLPNCP
jgi:hypothetical protein